MATTKTPIKEFDLHSMAKKAKHRLVGKLDDTQANYISTNAKRNHDDYCKVLKMVLSEETISNPIARFIGKDLSTIPDSSEKQRLVFNAISTLDKLRGDIKIDAYKASRENRRFIVEDKEYDPSDILDKLN